MNTKRNISENQDFSRKDVLLRIEMFLSIVFTGTMVKNPPANAGNTGLIPGLGRSPGEGNGNPLQYFCMGNPMDKGAPWAMVHGVAKSWA